jgi:predicted metal-dependent peptidase
MKEMEWEAKTETAMEMATGAGLGQSPMVTRLGNKVERSKIPWYVEMQEFYVNALEQHESTFAAPNKKFLNLDLYLPSSRSRKVGPLAIGIDSSGSTEFYTEKFLAETSAVMAQCQPDLLVIASVDTKVHEIFELHPGDPLPSNVVQGGGGTDFRPFFKMIKKYEPAPLCIVFLTDMDTGADWPTDPGIPTLWVSTTARYRKPPFGRVIVMV